MAYMIRRLLEPKCKCLAKRYPVLLITGPRQSGKTTLAKMAFPRKSYANLEAPDVREFAIGDPRGFLASYPKGAIIDEIQRVPELTSYIQTIVDERKENGLYILTGSQHFSLVDTVSQSLSGRVGIVKLLPFSLKEIRHLEISEGLDSLMFTGFYPRIYDESIPPRLFHQNYFETYIQRDIRQLSQIENLIAFERFVRIVATWVGQLLNYNSIANDLGVSQPTVRKWINLLSASYIVFLLPPYYRNIGKRLIKTPKVYFYDTGLLCYLLGVKTVSQLKHHPLRGNIFENFVISEVLKDRYNQLRDPNLYFFRDRTGHEVDLIIEDGLKLVPIEIKISQTPSSEFVKNIEFFNRLFGQDNGGIVIYAGTQRRTYKDVLFLPWREMNERTF